MNEKRPQTLANHARLDPLFHFLVAPLLIACVGYAIYAEIHRPSSQHGWFVVLSLAVFLLAFLCRSYALKVQDRVIRLEERLRLSALLSEPLRSRIPELTEAQLIALRFAADDEVPSLIEKILRENLDPKQIKKAINQWRPDYWRV